MTRRRFRYKQSDDTPSLEYSIRDARGETVDLSDADEVRLYVDDGDRRDPELIVNDAVEIVDAPEGAVRYEWDDQLKAAPGDYRLEWVVIWQDGSQQTDPVGGFYSLVISGTTAREHDPATFDDPDVSLTQLFADTIRPNTENSITHKGDRTLEDGTNVDGTLSVTGEASVTEAPTDAEDVVRKQEADALQDEIEGVDADLQVHTDSSEAHGADGDVQGENDVSTTVEQSREDHRKNDVHEEPQPPQSHDLGGEEHDATSLEALNDLVDDATLDDSGSERPPKAHDHEDDTLVPSQVGTESNPVGQAVTSSMVTRQVIDANQEIVVPADHGMLVVGELSGEGSISGSGTLTVI